MFCRIRTNEEQDTSFLHLFPFPWSPTGKRRAGFVHTEEGLELTQKHFRREMGGLKKMRRCRSEERQKLEVKRQTTEGVEREKTRASFMPIQLSKAHLRTVRYGKPFAFPKSLKFKATESLKYCKEKAASFS